MTSSFGLAALEGMLKEAASRRNFTPRKRIHDFRWDAKKNPDPRDNSIALRFLGDDIIIGTRMHRFIPLPNGKMQSFVCRRAKPISADHCYICDEIAPGISDAKRAARYKASDWGVGLAVEQELVYDGKKFEGYKDKLVEFEIPVVSDFEKGDVGDDWKRYRELLNNLGDPGTKVLIPNVGIVQAGLSTFWSYATTRKTICDRVYEISRQGAQLDTKYFWNHEGPDNPVLPIEEVYARYATYPFETPMEWVTRMSDPGRYEYFFNQKADDDQPSGVVGSGSSQRSSASSYEQSSADDEEETPVATSRQDLMNRLRGKSS